MHVSVLAFLCASAASAAAVVVPDSRKPMTLLPRDDAPIVTVKNGTYHGTHLPAYNQDVFLGIPYSQPPVGPLRFRVPQPLNESWPDVRNATEYGPQCIGYGSDDWVLGNIVSEDCLTINVIRPSFSRSKTSSSSSSSLLPVAFWIHGGGYFEGGARDPRYNLSFIVQQSQAVGTPMIAVSINYRLAQWGFMYSREMAAEGASNLGLRDQRLAMHWVQENIAAFGGDPTRVTIWGESAGGNSIGSHLVAYGGRNDGLFRAAISQSGAPTGLRRYLTPAKWQPAYDAYARATGCLNQSVSSLDCLRSVPAEELSALFNNTDIAYPSIVPVLDGDFLPEAGAQALKQGHFVKVPYLIGANSDEGGSFGQMGINTTDEFVDLIKGSDDDAGAISNATAATLEALYPDIPAIGIPATTLNTPDGRPPPGALRAKYGYMWKRSAAFMGDQFMHVGRRLSSQVWAQHNISVYSYRFNVLVNGLSPLQGSAHFQEVAFVFNNIQGLGYDTAVSVNPFAGKPATYSQLAHTMSRMWVSFVTKLDPNALRASAVHWPQYSVDSPKNIVFDTNATHLAYLEPDIYRAEAIGYLISIFDTVLGR